MKTILLSCTALFYITNYGFSQDNYWDIHEDYLRKKNNVIDSKEKYLSTINNNPDKQLIPLDRFGKQVKFEIRYATDNNFLNTKLYNEPEIVVRKVVYDSLKKVLQELKQYGLGIKFFDTYRPYSVTLKMFKMYPDSNYVASPFRGSKHNRGCALDMTLFDLKTGKDLKMPTDYDVFDKKAWPKTKLDDEEATKNRDLLVKIMNKYGFKVSVTEWWHYDYKKYKQYEILDIPFNKIREVTESQ